MHGKTIARGVEGHKTGHLLARHDGEEEGKERREAVWTYRAWPRNSPPRAESKIEYQMASNKGPIDRGDLSNRAWSSVQNMKEIDNANNENNL